MTKTDTQNKESIYPSSFILHPSLKRMLETSRFPHALILTGGTRNEREELAQAFASEAIKNKKAFHPDIHHFHPKGKLGTHTIESLRKLTEEVALLPVEAKMQFFIIHEASAMLPTSSNALLKTLEEPISHSIMILLTDCKEKLLPTIVSRCQTISLSHPQKTLTEEQRVFLHLLTKEPSFEKIEEFAKEKEERKKEEEKRLFKEIPKELTSIQRECFEKEIEATCSCRFKEEAKELFEVILLLAHDQTMIEVGLPKRLESSIEKKLKFSEVESALKISLLSLDRSISFQSILPSLFIQLGF